jgi:inosine/xanthosine triphosphatase
MKIFVGSKNQAKLLAVREIAKDYPALKGAKIIGSEIKSGVSDQPKSFRETVQGAKNRARGVFREGELAIGLESGLIKVPGSRNGFMDVCVCVIYNGKTFSLGLSSGFECPPEMNRLIMEEGMDMTQAANKIGLTKNPKLGSAEGLIGILTKGRVTRQEYTKQALIMALVQIENQGLY